MKMRLDEGSGEAIYDIGMLDDGTALGLPKENLDKTLTIIEYLATKLNSQCIILKTTKSDIRFNTDDINNKRLIDIYKRCNPDMDITNERYLTRVKIRKIENNYDLLRIACIGNVDSGKSTTLGVLCTGKLDSSKEKSRDFMFNHQHEKESGRTSSVGQQIMGFTQNGEPVYQQRRPLIDPWVEVYHNSKRIVQFYDLAGHRKYFSNMIKGLCSSYSNYCLMTIGGNMGIGNIYDDRENIYKVDSMAKEHLIVAMALSMPIIIVITKLDIAPKNVLDNTIDQLDKYIRSIEKSKRLKEIKSINDISELIEIKKYEDNKEDSSNNANNSKQFLNPFKNKIPVLKISNTTGEGLELLQNFLYKIPKYDMFSNKINNGIRCTINGIYKKVVGVGLVASIVVLDGIISIGSKINIGPDQFGKYFQGEIKTIHDKRVSVRTLSAGNNGTITFTPKSKISGDNLRIGMMLIDDKYEQSAVREFDAMIKILGTHNSAIKTGYECNFFTSTIRQTIKIIEINNPTDLLNDNIINLRFRFTKRPEYIQAGTIFLFSEGRMRGYGKVI